jgi:hypothetical protein
MADDEAIARLLVSYCRLPNLAAVPITCSSKACGLQNAQQYTTQSELSFAG